jgi:CRP/FNR family transcriptional regulator, anaerobic regulatory protein
MQITTTGTSSATLKELGESHWSASCRDLQSINSACAECGVRDGGLCAAIGEKVELAAEVGRGASSISSLRTIGARRTIYHQKESPEFVSIVCSGWACSSTVLADGRRQILSFHLPGDSISLSAIFDPTWGRFVESITEVTYRNFRREDLKELVLTHPDLTEKVFKAWVAERKQIDRLAVDLGRRTGDERLAGLLVWLFDQLSKRGMVRGHVTDFPLRQRHIADATGLTPVHVSKVLGEFQKSGLVEFSGRSLTIIDMQQLQRVAGWQ